MNNSTKLEVNQIKEWFIKPKKQTEDSKKPIYLTPWDLLPLSLHYNQKGLFFTKPPPPSQNFSIDNLLETLRDSLALTLVHFYPLAGQLHSELDQDRHKLVVLIEPTKGPGAKFIHASLDMTISDLLHPTRVPLVVHSLFDHVDWKVINYDGQSRPLVCVQVTDLIDGVFIGCSMNHAVADGTSFWHFWNVWSEIHRAITSKGGHDEMLLVSRPPLHARWFSDRPGSRGHPLPFTHPDEFIHRYQPDPQLVDQVFHVTSSSIAKLKAKANEEANNSTNSTNNKMISSFQALATLVWRAITRAKQLAPWELAEIRIATNNRTRLHPPLPDEYFGNAVQPIINSLNVDQLLGHNLGWTAALLHQSIMNHTDKVVRGFIDRWAHSPFIANMGKFSNSVKTGSSPGFNVYSVEFGELGKPVAIRSGFANRFDGKVNFHPGREGAGSVDLEICLMPDSMEALEVDQEFMAVVSSSSLDGPFYPEVDGSEL